MRVLYLTMNPNRQSTTVPTEGWFRLLRPRGLEPVLVSNQSGAFQAWTQGEGIPSYEVVLPFPNRLRPWTFLRSLARLVRIGRKHRVELVHCNEHDVYPIGQYAARLLGVPIVVTAHCTLRDGYSRWAFGESRLPDRVFFVSRSSMDACRPDIEGVVPEERWRLLHNGLDLRHYVPDEQKRREFRRTHGLDGELVIGAACALRPLKQLEHLFAATARLTGRPVRLVVAGAAVAGDEEYAANLLRHASEQLGAAFLHIGHQEDLRPFYNALDLFVNTSSEESFGISVLEALACGCPVIGYPSVSVEEVVMPGGGEIVPQNSIPRLAEALDRWLSEPNRLVNARASARKRAEDMFDIEDLAQQLWREYESLLPARPRSAA